MVQSVTLRLLLEKLSVSLIDQLDDLCKRSVGPHRLRIEITDRRRQLRLLTASRERKVMANHDFISAIKKLGFDYSLHQS
jgi:EAL domain-containing protein (putative c-di-GMP-specific phosphodiesterase class I)